MIKFYLRLVLATLVALTGLWAQSDYTFSDGGRQANYRLAQDEVFSKASLAPAAAGSHAWGGGTVLKLSSGEAARKMVKSSSARSRGSMSPVFYYAGDLPTAEKLAALPAVERDRMLANARRAMTAKLLVRLEKAQTKTLAETQPTGFETSLLSGWMLVSYADAFAALDAADWMTQKGGFEFSPVFSRTMNTRQALARDVNDPLYPKQWHLQPAAPFNLSMGNTWDSVTGKDINIAVIDDGLEVKHEDLFSNSFPLGQGFHRNFNDGDPTDPTPTDIKQNHGTSCAGLAAATGFNSLGVSGVAPEARMMGLRLIAGATSAEDNGTALAWQPDGIITHVSSNSWGPADDGKSDGTISSLQLAGMRKGVTENRNKLGTVYLISAGNGRSDGDDESYDGFSSSRYGIAVAAVNRGGTQSSYSENGMAVAIAAFGGEFQPPDVTWTTNNSGPESYALLQTKAPTTTAPINYTDSMNGTSAAAPQISGAVALMLQKNPLLGYRDVKEILMTTGNAKDLKGSTDFFKNGAGLTLSHSFGAGVVNVAAAVELAGKWKNLGPEISVESLVNFPVPIPEVGSDVATLEFDLSSAQIRVEHVEFTFTLTHAKRGTVSFGLQSPAGTLSLAAPRSLDDNANFIEYTMTSVMNWGESAAGKWKLLVADNVVDGIKGDIRNVKLVVYGTAK